MINLSVTPDDSPRNRVKPGNKIISFSEKHDSHGIRAVAEARKQVNDEKGAS